MLGDIVERGSGWGDLTRTEGDAMKLSQMRAKARSQLRRGTKGTASTLPRQPAVVIRGREFTPQDVVVQRTAVAQKKWDAYRAAL